MDGGPVALLRRDRRPCSEGGASRDGARDRRCRARDGGAAALLLAELETEAGLPPGWLNVVAGSSADIGDVLIEDERVKALTFTGSDTVGWKLAERAPRKRVKLELGNSTPVIVEADADLEQ